MPPLLPKEVPSSTLAEGLVALLDAYDARLNALENQAAIRDHADRAEVRGEVNGWLKAFRQGNPFRVALDAWPGLRDRPRQLIPGVGASAVLHLHALLRALDEHHRHLDVVGLPHREHRLLVGRRWWDGSPEAAGGEADAEDDEGPEETEEFASSSAFPRLRRGYVAEADWVVGDEVDVAFAGVAMAPRLRVGLSTLTHSQSTRFVPTGPRSGRYGFVSGGVDGSLSAALCDTIRWARKSGVHILFLPELTVDSDGLDVLERELLLDPGSLRLVVPGSYHVPTGTGHRANAAPVWLVAETGRVVPLGRVGKAERFSVRAVAPDKAPAFVREVHAAADEAEEGYDWLIEDTLDIGSGVVVRTPVGVVSALICKDVLVDPPSPPRTHRASEAVRAADHLGLLSMNENRVAWFGSRAAVAVRQHLTGTYYANAAFVVGAQDSAVALAFWLLPPGRGAVSSEPEAPDARSARRMAFYARRPESTPDASFVPGQWPVSGHLMVEIPVSLARAFPDDL